MSGSLPASVALVATSRWRSENGEPRTTIVAKMTVQLANDNKAALVTPEAIVEFDRMAPDGRHVIEAAELVPWTSVASIVAYAGPVRLTLESDAGEPIIVATASAKSPAGYSMSSAERSSFAPRRPARSSDGVLTIPDGVDGRYFVAAPKAHQLASLRGDERFVLELAGWRSKRRLPGLAVMATVAVGATERSIVLTPDMLVIHGGTRRISVVARAVVRGDAKLLGHSVAPIASVTTRDAGDPPRSSAGIAPRGQDPGAATGLSFEETSDTAGETPPGLAAPFDLDPPSADIAARARLAQEVPATPFDPGFAPAHVEPGAGLTHTLKADDDLTAKIKDLRAALRANAPPSGAQDRPAAPIQPAVAPPKPNAMAKPRLKRR